MCIIDAAHTGQHSGGASPRCRPQFQCCPWASARTRFGEFLEWSLSEVLSASVVRRHAEPCACTVFRRCSVACSCCICDMCMYRSKAVWWATCLSYLRTVQGATGLWPLAMPLFAGLHATCSSPYSSVPGLDVHLPAPTLVDRACTFADSNTHFGACSAPAFTDFTDFSMTQIAWGVLAIAAVCALQEFRAADLLGAICSGPPHL